MEKPLSTASDLRSALLPWIIVSFVVAGTAYVASAYWGSRWFSGGLAALSSAAVSVGLALLITEYVLKPLYVRDILKVARLSAEVHDAGLVSLQRLTKLDLTDYLTPGAEIDIVGQPDIVLQVWPAILDWATMARSSVRVHLPERVEPTVWRNFEITWKDKGCNKNGSALLLTAITRGTLTLALLTKSHCLVAVSDGANSLGNPLVAVLTRARPVSYVHSVASHIEGIRDSTAIPLYDSGEERSSDRPDED